jgi:hypothetical protein
VPHPLLRRALAGTLATTTGLLATLLLVGAGPADAAALCTARPVTNGTAGDEAIRLRTPGALSGDGSTVVFLSDGDHLGTNADRSEEVWHLRIDGALTQVTDTTAAVDHGAPATDDDGGVVAFDTDATLGGTNPDGNRDVVLWSASSHAFTNMSATSGGGDAANRLSDVSGDGSTVLYRSTQNPFGHNADANEEIFFRLVGTNTRVQVTETTGGANDLGAIDDAGDTIVFRSNRNLDGGNGDGNFELFATEAGSGVFDQVTNGTNGTAARNLVDLDATGTTALFITDSTLSGINPDGRLQVLRVDVASHSGALTVFNQEGTGTPDGSISDDGTRASVTVAADPLGTNPDDGLETFLHERTTAEVTQVSRNAALSLVGTSLDDRGTRLVGRDDTDDFGGNDDDGQEVFVLACSASTPTFTDVGTSHPFFDEIEWMAAARVSTGFQPGPTYQPSAAVSRAAMSAFMFRLAGSPLTAAPPVPTFGDVGTGHPFYEEIEWMAEEGITTGTPASPKPLFKPADAVSRSAMSAFMFRLAGSPDFADPPTPTFTDVGTGHPFFTEIEWMAEEGITTGFQPGPTYAPSAAVSRQAMSAFMFRLADGPGVDLTSD